MTQSCIRGAWKKLCPQFAADFKGFDLIEKLSEEHLKCLELAKKVGLDELGEDNVYSLLETTGEELSTEDLDEREKQQRQLGREVEAEPQPTAPSKTRHLTVTILQRFYAMLSQTTDYLKEIDHDVKQTGPDRHKVLSDQMLYEKRKEASQATLDAFFSKASLPEASANDEPPTSEESATSDKPPASDEPQPSMSTSGFTRVNIPSLSSSDTDDPDAV